MRTELAAEVGRIRDAVVEGVSAAGVQNARQHLDFLQAAVELDDPLTFRDYAVWCRDFLSSRGVSVELLVENLETIRDELVGRLSPPAADAVGSALGAGLGALAAGEVLTRTKGDPFSPSCRLYLAASVSGLREVALEIVREAMRGGHSPVDVYIDIFQCALYEVGRRWQTTGLTIAEEHMATATTQFVLSVLNEEHPPTGSRSGAAVVTGVVDEQHVVGASIVASILDAEGWDVRFLGTNLPHHDIVSAIDQHRASLVAISVTMSDRVADARDLIAQIRRGCASAPRIIVGGAAFIHDEHLWQTVGADGFARDARTVAELVRT